MTVSSGRCSRLARAYGQLEREAQDAFGVQLATQAARVVDLARAARRENARALGLRLEESADRVVGAKPEGRGGEGEVSVKRE